MPNRRAFALATIFLAGAAALPPAAAANDYPNRPIRLVIGFSAGGPTDAILRILAQDMSLGLGVNVVVENKPGANSMIASCDVARAAPDGYTLLGATLADNVNAILVPERAQCRATRDFEPVGLAAVIPMMAVTTYGSPIHTIADLVQRARANPGKVSYGSAGNGGSAHLAGALLATQAKVDMLHVPFKGNAPALTEVMAGRVDFMFYPMIGVLGMTQQKRIRPLAVSLPQRHPDFPEVPTMRESGYPDFEEYSPGIGLLAPAGTPAPLVEKLNQALTRTLAKPEIVKRLADLGAVPAPGSPAAYRSWLASDYARWERLIKAAGVRAE